MIGRQWRRSLRAIERLGFSKFRNLFGHKNYGAYAIVGRPFQVTPKLRDLNQISGVQTLDDDAEKATDTFVERLKILQKAAAKQSLRTRKNNKLV